MQNYTFRTLVTVLLLAAAWLTIYMPPWLKSTQQRVDRDEADMLYVVDLDYWQRTNRERLVEATTPFDLAHDLNQTPLEIGEWQGQDVPETNLETFILLEPEQFVQRLYQDKAGHKLWLNLIGSRKSRSFHPPDISYNANGWYVSVSSQVIALEGGGEIYGLWMEAQKQRAEEASSREHMVYYFYLFPNSERDQADGIVLFKVTTPRYGTVKETLALQANFLRHLFMRAIPTQ